MTTLTSTLAGDLHRRNLARAIAPRSIALVGASSREGSFGRRTLANLSGFSGRLYLVNASAQEIDGQRCHPSVASLPEVPDCVILAVPQSACEAVVRECIEVGVGGVVIYASGFAETDDTENRASQVRLTQMARQAEMALFGPNCLGVVNYTCGAVMSFTGWPAAQPLVSHSIAIVSQSGSLGVALAQSASRGVSISHVLTYGNGAGVDAADLVAYLAEDASCSAIVCVLEGAGSPMRLIEAARLARSKGKPLIVQKIAAGQEGARAALSHTGSLVGDHDSYAAVLRSAGAVWVDDFESLVETATFFAKAPAPRSTGVAVIGGSGGGGIMAADKAEAFGVAMPQPSEATTTVLQRHIPAFGSARNPCDVTAQVVNDPQSLAACCNALAADDAYGAIVSTQTVAATEFIQRLGIYEQAAAASGKPVCTVWLSEWREGPGAIDFERSASVALFTSMSRCFQTLRAWHERCALLSRQRQPLPAINESGRVAVRQSLESFEGTALPERPAKALLASYGIPVVEDLLARDAAHAVRWAEHLGYPVALKVSASDLLHKSDLGGVRLDLADAGAVTDAFYDILTRVSAAAPLTVIEGVLVSPMVRGSLEVLVGGRNDLQFGPLITVGMGGVLVELLRDSVTAQAPVNPAQAAAMLRQLKAAPLFDGFRGQPAIDLTRLADIVSRASMLLAETSDIVAELDINPLICGPRGVTAVDVLVVLVPQATLRLASSESIS